MTLTLVELREEIESGPLAAELAADWAAGNTGAVAAALNAPRPELAVPVPRTLYESEIGTLLTAGSLAKFRDHVNFGLVKADIERGNHLGVWLWTAKFADTLPGGFLLPAEVAAVQGYCGAWTATGFVPATIDRSPASRAEVLAGQAGAAVTISDVDDARVLV
jgi:hypothetical protein